jgi:hypothetical protein
MSGDFQMIRLDTGDRLTIKMDGSEIRDSIQPPSVEYCDKCNNTKEASSGSYETWQGLKVYGFARSVNEILDKHYRRV